MCTLDPGKNLIFEPWGVKGVKNTPKMTKMPIFASLMLINLSDFCETLQKVKQHWNTHILGTLDPGKGFIFEPWGGQRGQKYPQNDKKCNFAS